MTSRATHTAQSTVDIEKLVYGGDGLARIDGQVVLVPFVLPGEQIQVSTTPLKKGLLRGVPQRVTAASPQRITPKCEYFANCGGCHYQHAGYEFQLDQKRSILRETLQRLGGIRYEDDIHTISGEPWHYRNRVQLHFQNQALGFRKADSHELCDITHCEISSPVLNDVIAKLQSAIGQPEWPAFMRSLEIFTNELDVQFNVLETTRPVASRFFTWCSSFVPSLVPSELYYLAARFKYRVSRGSFFQVNRFLADALVNEVLSDSEGVHAIDLYAGVGLFSVPLARKFTQVNAVERGGAQRDLDWNVTESQAQVTTARTNAEEFLTNVSTPPDLIVADPPRAGLGPEVTAQLKRVLPARLTIVSCDPATLARDLRALLPIFNIRRLTLVDLFPQTYHFETVVHLQRT